MGCGVQLRSWLVHLPPLTYPPQIRPYDQGLWKPIGFPEFFRPKIKALFLVGVVLMGLSWEGHENKFNWLNLCQHSLLIKQCRPLGCPRKLVNCRFNGLFHLLINGVQWGYIVVVMDLHLIDQIFHRRSSTWDLGIFAYLGNGIAWEFRGVLNTWGWLGEGGTHDGSMGGSVHLPTWMVDLFVENVGKCPMDPMGKDDFGVTVEGWWCVHYAQCFGTLTFSESFVEIEGSCLYIFGYVVFENQFIHTWHYYKHIISMFRLRYKYNVNCVYIV